MSVIEIASAVSLIIAAATVCFTKVIAQLENNKISFCSCLGGECRRDTEAVVDIVPTEDVQKTLEHVTEQPDKKPKRFIQKNNLWVKTQNELSK